MLIRMFGSRGFLSLCVIVLLGATAVGGYHLMTPSPRMQTYCADMPDAIGVYEGSEVTIMGMKIGSITSVAPHGTKARIEFEIPESRRLPADVGATTMADSLIADRSLALIGPEPDGPGWDSAACITKTLTPKSLSETFSALADVAGELTQTDGPGRTNVLERGVESLNAMSSGTGGQINAIIQRLGSALESPDATIGSIGALLDALGSLMSSAAHYWPEIKDFVSRLEQSLVNVNEVVVPPVLTVLTELHDILPALNDLTVTVGGPLLSKLEAVEDLPRLLEAGVAGLDGALSQVPVVSGAFARVLDPATGAVSVAYASPIVTMAVPGADRICKSVNAATGTRDCVIGPDGALKVPLTRLVLGTAGGR